MTSTSTLATPTGDTRATALRGLCGGAIHLPGDPGYDQACRPWNTAHQLRPAAVAVPRTSEDVAEVVRAARAARLRVAPMSTGHLAGAFDTVDLGDVVLVWLTEMTGVEIDSTARVARVRGGTLWQQVVEEAGRHGLAAMHGSSPDVAVAGYTLGGGLSWYARRHGLACSALRAAEIVTADGSIRRVDDACEPRLMWALRGGGGTIGVITELEFDLLPYPQAVAGMLVWDQRRAAEIVPAWLAWTRGLPDEVTSSLRLMNLPPLPDIPAPLRGRRLVIIDGVVLGDDAADVLAPLRALAPELDTWAHTPAAALTRLHMDPEGPTPAVGGDLLLREATADTVAALLDVAGPDRPTPLLAMELRHLGGALGRPGTRPAALAALAGDYAFFCAAIAPTSEAATLGRAAIGEVSQALRPWAEPTRYLNFTEESVGAEAGFSPEVVRQLRQAKQAWDPEQLLVGAHPVR